MADDAPATGDSPDPKDTPEEPETNDDPVVAQADNPDAVKNALAAERAAKKAAEQRANELAAKVDEFENANKSELERAQNKVTKAEERAAKAEALLVRYEVAKDKEIPAEAVDLLNGTTREELEASADKILALVKSRTDNQDKPNFDGGARESAGPADPEAQINDLALQLLTGTNNS